jgi:thermitase
MLKMQMRWIVLALAMATLAMAGGVSADTRIDPLHRLPIASVLEPAQASHAASPTKPLPDLWVTPSSVQILAQIGDTLTVPSLSVLNIANLDGDSMGWTASASPTWIAITPTASSAPGPLMVTINDVGSLTTGTATYNGVITVSAVPSQTTHSPQAIPVTLRVVTNVYQARLQPIFYDTVTPTVDSPITPTDPYYGLQWGLARVQAGMAWTLSTGSPSVTTAVLDTGVYTAHPDLIDKLVPGHNFANGSDDTLYQDECNHGTHVAGIAAAATDNAIGVAGLGWQTRLMPVKVMGGDLCQGSYEDVIRGIDWATRHGAQVINLSLGGPYDAVMDTATTNAFAAGTLVVAAAGNCGSPDFIFYGCSIQDQLYSPAGNAHVLGVAATNQSDTRAPFSTANASVEIAAPGVDIYSTWPGGYQYLGGTSMATPFVSGLAALMYARFPSYTPTQVAQAITANADLVGGQTGWSQEYGCGRINAYRALAYGASASCTGWNGLAAPASRATPLSATVARHDYVPGQLLVTLRAGRGKLQAQAIARRYGLAMSDLVPHWRVYRLHVPVGKELVVLSALRADPSIEAVSLNARVYPQ